MVRRWWPVLGLIALMLLAACGGSPPAATVAPTPTVNVAPTQTRAAELAQIATLTAPTATAPPPTATPPPPTALPPTATRPIPTALLPTAVATPDSALGRGSFVGRLDGSETFVAIVVSGTEVMAYVCDGNTLARWFTGTRQGSSVDLRAQSGERLTANLGATPANGSLRQSAGAFTAANGQSLRFNSTATTGLDRAGLYRGTAPVDGGEAVLGVIVLPGDEFRGAFSVQGTATGVTSPAFGAGNLTAVYGGSVPILAPRLGNP